MAFQAGLRRKGEGADVDFKALDGGMEIAEVVEFGVLGKEELHHEDVTGGSGWLVGCVSG
jgi:hypothetical protein